MACKSASVERAEKKFQKALEVIRKLDESMQIVTQEEVDEFNKRITDYADENGINDFKFNDLSIQVKVDYTGVVA